jgi:hypothetical protein
MTKQRDFPLNFRKRFLIDKTHPTFFFSDAMPRCSTLVNYILLLVHLRFLVDLGRTAY